MSAQIPNTVPDIAILFRTDNAIMMCTLCQLEVKASVLRLRVLQLTIVAPGLYAAIGRVLKTDPSLISEREPVRAVACIRDDTQARMGLD